MIETHRLAVAGLVLVLGAAVVAQTESAVNAAVTVAADGAATTSGTELTCCGTSGTSRLAAMLGAINATTPTLALPADASTTATTTTAAAAPPGQAPPGMVWIPAGEYVRGTDDPTAWPSEQPAHRVQVDGFWMDKTEVTNADFEKFVTATGYLTTAETTPTLEDIMKQVPPGTPPPPAEALVPGGLVFVPPSQPVPLNNEAQWWQWTPNANWRQPEGPGSSIVGRENHPVVMVSWFDAKAYADWAGKRLPTEAEWERAARGGLEQNEFTWGTEFAPEGRLMANVWQGQFPHNNTTEDGWPRTAPVGQFAPNGYGLYDVSGNVWEWCSDWFQSDLYSILETSRVLSNPQGPDKSLAANRPYEQQRVIKGGSFLCHVSYCSSYRPSARMGTTPDTGMSHMGFRLVKSAEAPAAVASAAE